MFLEFLIHTTGHPFRAPFRLYRVIKGQLAGVGIPKCVSMLRHLIKLDMGNRRKCARMYSIADGYTRLSVSVAVQACLLVHFITLYTPGGHINIFYIRNKQSLPSIINVAGLGRRWIDDPREEEAGIKKVYGCMMVGKLEGTKSFDEIVIHLHSLTEIGEHFERYIEPKPGPANAEQLRDFQMVYGGRDTTRVEKSSPKVVVLSHFGFAEVLVRRIAIVVLNHSGIGVVEGRSVILRNIRGIHGARAVVCEKVQLLRKIYEARGVEGDDDQRRRSGTTMSQSDPPGSRAGSGSADSMGCWRP
jgi:hypothetical protein